MPKYIIKEGMLDKLVSGLFDTIVKGKQARAKEKLKNDPKLKKLYAKLDKISSDVGSFLSRHSR